VERLSYRRSVRGRLFPPEDHWFPILWPIYLAIPLIALGGRLSAAGWLAEAFGLLLFLLVYTFGHWASTVAQRWAAVCAVCAIGVSMTLTLASDNVIVLVYAAYFAGRQPKVMPMCGGLTLILGLIGVLFITRHLTGTSTIITALIATAVAGAQIGVRRLTRVNAELRQTRRDVERLARVAERARIAQDLHDVLGQTLSVVVLKSQIAARLAAHEPQRVVGELKAIEFIARDALSQVRAVVRGYRTEGVMAECANARAVLTEAGMECALARPPPLPPATDAALALVLREAVTNVLRHSGAGRCEIHFSSSKSGVQLTIEDDGRGFGGASDGSGLQGMRERLTAIGGSLTIGARHGGGTALRVELPLEQVET
jgi:two-component system sensor histidine kinase DesK